MKKHNDLENKIFCIFKKLIVSKLVQFIYELGY